MKKTKAQIKKEQIEISNKHGKHLNLIERNNTYITNLINGRYFLARCNMIAQGLEQVRFEQERVGSKLKPNDLVNEQLDGAYKTVEYSQAEHALVKMQAIRCFRTASFVRQELKDKLGQTEEDILKTEQDYYEGTVLRSDYGEQYKKKGKAEFTNTPESKAS